MSRRNLTQAGLVTCAGCPAVLLPVFIQAREAAKRTECRNNVDFLAYAMLMYANDNNDRLPLSNWTDSLFEYTGDHEVFKCPVLKQPFGYTFNAALVGKKVSDIQQPALVPRCLRLTCGSALRGRVCARLPDPQE